MNISTFRNVLAVAYNATAAVAFISEVPDEFKQMTLPELLRVIGFRRISDADWNDASIFTKPCGVPLADAMVPRDDEPTAGWILTASIKYVDGLPDIFHIIRVYGTGDRNIKTKIIVDGWNTRIK